DMARKVREKALDTVAARDKLKVRAKPYYRSLGPDLHIGYRKGKDARRWVVRMYTGAGQYVVETIGHADDVADADGVNVLDFWQAQEKARKIHREAVGSHGAGSVKCTVQQAIDAYIDHLEGRASYEDTKLRLAAYVPDHMGAKEVAKLTKEDLVRWHKALARV